jgi:hypothetical protein
VVAQHLRSFLQGLSALAESAARSSNHYSQMETALVRHRRSFHGCG